MAQHKVRIGPRGGLRVNLWAKAQFSNGGVGGTSYRCKVDSGKVGAGPSRGGEHRSNEAGGFLLFMA